MALTLTKGAKAQPHATILTGRSGIGKTFFASSIPTRFFICTESGLKGANPEFAAEIDKFDEDPESYSALMDQIQEFGKIAKQNGNRHLVIDSLSGIERLVNLETCNREDVSHMDAKEFKTLWTAAVPLWLRVQGALDQVRARGVHVWLLAHSASTTETVTETGDTFTKFDLSFQGSGKSLEAVREMWRRWADHVLFIDWDASIKKSKSIGQKAVGQYKARIMRTRETPAHYAKNRANLPPVIPATWVDLEGYMRAARPAQAAKLRTQIDEAVAGLGDEQKAAIVADVANAKNEVALSAALSRAQGMAAMDQDEDVADPLPPAVIAEQAQRVANAAARPSGDGDFVSATLSLIAKATTRDEVANAYKWSEGTVDEKTRAAVLLPACKARVEAIKAVAA